MGADWNVIRFTSERVGCSQFTAGMDDFSGWIDSHSLVDLQLSGGNFTWSNHQNPPILSRLDRFLASTDWLDFYPEVQQLLLTNPALNHCPILVDSGWERWGLAPFRFEKMWLEEEHFPDLVSDWWKEIRVEGWVGFTLALNLKNLKKRIKEWAEIHFRDVRAIKEGILEEIRVLDREEESGR